MFHCSSDRHFTNTLRVSSYDCWSFVYFLWRDVYLKNIFLLSCKSSLATFSNSLLIAYYHSGLLLQYNRQHIDFLFCFFNLIVFVLLDNTALSQYFLPQLCSGVGMIYLCNKKKDAGHCRGRKESFPNWSCVSFYWCLTSFFKCRGLTQHTLIVSQFPGIRSLGMTKLRRLRRVAQDGNQLCYVLLRGSLN